VLEWSIAGAILVVTSVLVAVRFLTSDLRAKRVLRKLARSEIADLVDGELAKVVGTVVHTGDLLASPNRNAACVFYHVWHEELRAGEKGGVGWVSAGDELHACAFAIDDGTGVVQIQSDEIQGALAASSYKPIPSTATERGSEAIIEVGQRIAVIGRATREVTPDGYRDSTSWVIRDGGHVGVVVSDDPNVIGD
jgi:hypothetical protein